MGDTCEWVMGKDDHGAMRQCGQPAVLGTRLCDDHLTAGLSKAQCQLLVASVGLLPGMGKKLARGQQVQPNITPKALCIAMGRPYNRSTSASLSRTLRRLEQRRLVVRLRLDDTGWVLAAGRKATHVMLTEAGVECANRLSNGYDDTEAGSEV